MLDEARSRFENVTAACEGQTVDVGALGAESVLASDGLRTGTYGLV
jgi:hypothetical protein